MIAAGRVLQFVPPILFAFALLWAGFIAGLVVDHTGHFPYAQIWGAWNVWKTLERNRESGPSNQQTVAGGETVPISQIQTRRVQALVPTNDSATFFVSGGEGQFRDLCPGDGCLAVEFSRTGKVLRSVPFRPLDFAHHLVADLPHDTLAFNPRTDMGPVVMGQFPSGDMLVGITFSSGFPYGGGVARVRRNGAVVWYRRDYAHHWPVLTASGDIVAPGATATEGPTAIAFADFQFELPCHHSGLSDTVEIIGPDGSLKKTYSVFDALNRSRFRGHIMEATDPCELTHVNWVSPVGARFAAKFDDVAPDDLLLSIRNLSAIAVLSRRTGILTHYFRGTFAFQHAAQTLADGRIILFDNLGVSLPGGPSRFVILDPATRAETTLLPRDPPDPNMPVFTRFGGQIAPSTDGSRAILTPNASGRAYEVDLRTGRVLTMFDNLQYPGPKSGDRFAIRVPMGSVIYGRE